MTRVFRISKKKYINDLSGIGAGLYGGRWNPKGINLVYTSGSISLASLEYMVHNYHLLTSSIICLAEIKLPDETTFEEMKISNMSHAWNHATSYHPETIKAGVDFVKSGQHYALKVPSAITPGEFNILLNPMHPLHSQTKATVILDPFTFDSRLTQPQ